MSKANRHIAAIRPDLEDLEATNVQARVIVGFCDDRGVPRNKDRFFIVTPRVGRQVEMGNGGKQDRANLHAACDAWNYATDAAGKRVLAGDRTIQIRLQQFDVEDSYSVGCICFRAEGVKNAPKPPGKSPYCKSADMVIASRWNGAAFADIQCQRQACPLRQSYQTDKGRKVDAKTIFRLTGRIDEEGVPALLVSVVTGSDYNLKQFAGLLDSTSAQWKAMCNALGIDIPFPGYGLPILLSIYESTGDGSRFPRIHYTLGCDIEELFQREIARRKRLDAVGRQLAEVLVPKSLPVFTEDDDALDAQEVLDPIHHMTDPQQAQQAISRFAPAPTQEEAPPVSAPVVTVEPERPAQATPARPDFTTGTDLRRQLTAATQAGDIDTVAGLLEASLEKLTAKPAAGPTLAKVWSDFAAAIHEAHPEIFAQLEAIGCPRPVVTEEADFTDDLPPPATEEEPNPFTAAAPPPEPPKPAQKVTPMERVEEYGKLLLASDDRDHVHYFRKLITEFVDLPADARARWEAIKRQKAGK